jgi:macrolide transport system ATP-binding/permease protein
MSWHKVLVSRVSALFRNRRLEVELDEEVRSHIDMLVDENIRKGMSPRQARLAANRSFGSLDNTKETYRDQRSLPFVESVFRDICYGVRMLAASPGVTAIAVLALALGIGASTTIFSFVDTLFFRPLPVQDPDRIVRVYSNFKGQGYGQFSYPEFAYFRDHCTVFEDLAGHYSYSPLGVVIDGDSKEEPGAVVSANYFSMLGIKPLSGRFFLPEEDTEPGRNPVAVISPGLWQRRLGGDASVLGKKLHINGTDFDVVGVMPEDFRGVNVGTPNDIWIPSMMLRVGYRWCDGFNSDCRPMQIIGKLAPGRTLTDARAELTTLAGQLATAYPATNEGRGIVVADALGVEPRARADSSDQMRLLMAAASLLLLIACTNVAGLLVARGAARRKEIALRLALGASRARLIHQLLTESLLIALPGGVLGLFLSLWAKDVMSGRFYSVDSEGYRLFYDLSLDWRVLIYALGLTLVTGLLFGLAPALQATRHDLTRWLKDSGAQYGSRHNRLRGNLVRVQVALSLALLVSAGVMARSAANVQAGANFDPENVALLRLRPRLVQYTPAKAQQFTREVVRRLEATPGVRSVSLAKGVGAAWRSTGNARVWLPENAPDREDGGIRAEYHEVAPRFLETLRIPLIEGREFDDRDVAGSPRVVIVNQTLAQAMWPSTSPLGRILVVEKQPYQVVGVSKDARFRNSIEPPAGFLYVAYWQNNFEPQVDSRMIVRVAGNPKTMLAALRHEITAVDSNVPISEDMAMAEQVDAEYLPVLLASFVLNYVGLIALILTAIGLYGVVAFVVSQRTREIGVRMALGARYIDVLALVVRQGMTLALVGLGFGLIAAYLLTPLLSSALYGVSAINPGVAATRVLLLCAVALVGCIIPARRAAAIDPMAALRSE